MVKKWLITGAAGFLGHHLVEHILRVTEDNIICIDKLSYASKGLEKLRSFDALSNKRVQIFTIDLINKISPGIEYEIGEIDYIIHLAAETHVDNSIADPVNFVMNNVASTLTMLEFARNRKNLEKFIYFSTDEIYGNAPGNIAYKEDDRQHPTNPYSASKSASKAAAKSASRAASASNAASKAAYKSVSAARSSSASRAASAAKTASAAASKAAAAGRSAAAAASRAASASAV